jgi:Tol biopolymer transport system component
VSGPVAQEKQGIWVISVIGASLKKLRDDAHDASLSRDGSQIVFRDSNTRDIAIMNADGSQARSLVKSEPGVFFFTPTWFENGKRIAYAKFHVSHGRPFVELESRNLQGADPVTLLSNSRLTDFLLVGDKRLIYAVREAPPNQYDTNLWELAIDGNSGKPDGSPRRLTDWTGFYFGNPELTADGKRLVFLNGRQQSDVYFAELPANGGPFSSPQHVTLDDRIDWPSGWLADGKAVLLYSDRNGHFDIYRQNIDKREAETVVAGSEEKWAPQLSTDGKWILFLQGSRIVEGANTPTIRLMRTPVAGGPSEAVMDVRGTASILSGGDPVESVGRFPSFRCPMRGSACVLAEGDDSQLTFTTFDPLQGRKAELTKVKVEPDFAAWDLSPDGNRIAVSTFDFKAGDVQIVSLSDHSTTKLSSMPWAELVAIAWSSDGKGLFLASTSSRGTSVVAMPLGGSSKLLFKKPSWDIFSLVPSPDGHRLALGIEDATANAWTIPSFPSQ